MKISRPMAIVAALAVTGAVQAKEGPDQYNHGAEGFMSGALPPPGTYFINYAGHYQGDMQDSDGNEVPGVSVKATFNALRFVHVTKQKILGADYGVHMIAPLVHQKISTPGGSKSTSGLGDIVVSPLVLGWHFPELHVIAALDFNLPTGKWSKSNPLERIGANYYSIEPVLAITYLNKSGFEASAKIMYNIKGENDDTDYQSGDEFRVDYTLAKHDGNWTYGIGGTLLRQTTSDEQNGVKIAGSKGKSFSIGPQIQYNYQGQSFIAKLQHETGVESRFKGNKLHLKYILAF